MPTHAPEPSGGGSHALPHVGVWSSMLKLLGRAFEADRARFPGLFHFMVVTHEAVGHAVHSPPLSEDGISVVHDGHRPIYELQVGFTRNRRVIGTSAHGAPAITEGWRCVRGFYGDADVPEGRRQLASFKRLAERAWTCLPIEVRRTLVVEPCLDPADGGDPAKCWIGALYALAWTGAAGGMLRADRTVYLKMGRTLNVEALCRLPDPVPLVYGNAPAEIVAANPGRPLGEHVSMTLDRSAVLTEEERKSIRIPPDHFAAFLEPDVFLASTLAIDDLLAKHGHWPAAPDGTGPPSPAAKPPVAEPPRRTRQRRKPRASSRAEVWISSADAAEGSGLSTDALRKRARREGWPTRSSGRMLCYRKSDLVKAWPHRRFEPPTTEESRADASGN